MIALASPGWQFAGFFFHLAGALACTIAGFWLVRHPRVSIPHRGWTLGALAATAAWCLAVAALGPENLLTVLSAAGRDIAWIFVLYRLFAADGRHQLMQPVRPVVAALILVILLQLAVAAAATSVGPGAAPDRGSPAFEISALLHILVAVGALVLAHNLYVGAAPALRPVLRWPAGALAAFWAYRLNLFTIAYLGGATDGLIAFQGLVAGLVGALLVFGGSAQVEGRRFSPSRTVAFRTLSLAVIGAYLLAMAIVAQSLSLLGDGLARLTQVGLLFAAAVLALHWLPSRKLRGWWRVTVIKHLFEHRYDYRAEWLRFTRTIGQQDGTGRETEDLSDRAIRAMAEVVESPSGLLFAPDEDGAFVLAGRWNWPDIEVPPQPIPAALATAIEASDRIVDIDQAADGADQYAVPEWIAKKPAAWAIVPLLHFERLQAVIVLSRPAFPRKLDWEDFDLLRIIGRQLASYLAERAKHEALLEARQFDEFSRRIAFVMHDVKNLASQLSLLARNAEHHGENPAFRADMLVTLRNSAEKLNALIARLGRYRAGDSMELGRVALDDIARRIAAGLGDPGALVALGTPGIAVLANDEALEQALAHLVQNAIEASDPGTPVYLDFSTDGVRARIDVVDSGEGMAPEFVRDGLFKPFVSSKSAGFGIGAFEARELVRAMGGRIDVDSRPGIGTRFSISLPIFAAAELVRLANEGATGGAKGK